MKRILCIWLPNWPLQRLLVARPELNRRAVVLHARLAGRGEQVVACSASAAACGIRPQMPLAEATALGAHGATRAKKTFQRNSDLCLEPHDPQADREALLRLAHWCERYSPVVGLEDAAAPESLLLDVTGLGHLFGGEAGLLAKVRRELPPLGYAIRLALADTLAMAWAWAHFGEAPGLCEASCDHASADELPIEALRLAPPVLDLLHQLGIERIGQLRQLPRASLAARIGDEPARRLDQLSGAAAELIVAARPLAELVAQWSLEYPTAHRESIRQIILRLVEQLVQQLAQGSQLAQGNQGIVELSCRLDCEGQRGLSLPVGLFRPTIEARHLMDLIDLRLERVVVPGPVHNVQVEVMATAQLVWRQSELFAAERAVSMQHLALLVDRLSSRLGRDRVVRPQLQASPQPERSFRYVPLAGAQARGKRTSRAATQTLTRLGPVQCPLWLFSPPRAIDAMSVVPDGPLIGFYDEQQQHRIARHWGPQRIETGWWRGRSVQRDYYRVETDSGARFWVFRRLPDGQWFLHGEFI